MRHELINHNCDVPWPRGHTAVMGDIGRDREIIDMAEQLAAAFPEVPHSVIDKIVTASWEELAGRPLRDAMSLLAERTAREALRRQRSGR